MTEVHGWRRAARWGRNIVLGMLGTIVVVVLGVYVFFETRYGREVLRGQIESRLAAAFVGGASIGRIDGNPLTELVLEDVVINDASASPAIKVKRLTIEIPLLPLISHELRVNKVIAEDLDVLVARGADGALNLANLRNPSEPSTWSVALPSMEIHRGHVRLALGTEPIDIDNIELDADASLPFGGPIAADVAISADWRQKRAPIDAFASVYVGERELRVLRAGLQLADIDIAITQLAVARTPGTSAVDGVVSVYAPRSTIEELAPQLAIPGDVGLLVSADAKGRLTHTHIKAAVGDSRIDLAAIADIDARLVHGRLAAERLDLTALTRGAIHGAGGAAASFEIVATDAAPLPTISALIDAWGTDDRSPRTRATVAVTAVGDLATAQLAATNDSGLRADVTAAMRVHGERWTLEQATVVAFAPSVRDASQGVVPVRGALDANLTLHGTIAPALDVAVVGHANGRRLRFEDVSAGAFALRVDVQHLPSKPVGTARVVVDDVRRGKLELGRLTVAASNRPDGKLQVSVRSRPTHTPWLVDVDALVTTGETIQVDLQRHRIRAANGALWQGTTGSLTIAPREIELRGLRSRGTDGRLTAAARYVRTGRAAGNLHAQLDTTINVATMARDYAGKLDAHVDVAREHGRWSGTVHATAAGVALGEAMHGTVDADVEIALTPDRLRADVAVRAHEAGAASVALDVEPPRDLADVRGWRRLTRDAVRRASVTLDDVDLAALATLLGTEPMAGHVDGEVVVGTAPATGALRARGIQVSAMRDLGTLDADLQLNEASSGELHTTASARWSTAGRTNGNAKLLADVRVEPPARWFDPAAWRRLGLEAVRGGTVRVERLAFQPGLLERFGIVTDLRGELAVGVELGPSLDFARVAVDVYGLRGGRLAQPIDASLSAIVDGASTRVTASVSGANVTLARVRGEVPLSFAELRADPAVAKTARLDATVTIPNVPAQAILTVLGTSQVTGGVLDGRVEVRGTVARPTVEATLVARDVMVPTGGSRPAQAIHRLTIRGTWDGDVANVTVDGTQSAGGRLNVRAIVDPANLDAATASLVARKLDIAPLVAFIPGPAGALAGRLEADLKIRGANPTTADVAGDLRVTGGRIPIAPAVGTLFQGELAVGIHNRALDVRLTGKLGRGDVKLVAHAPLEGATPTSGKLELRLENVELIETTRPIITGTLTADIARVDEVWRANLLVAGTHIKLPENRGTKLAPAGAPADVVFRVRENGPADVKAPSQVEGPVPNRDEPSAPAADIKIKLANVFVESHEVRGLVGGNLRVTLGSNMESGIIGRVAVTRGVVELFGRRYQVDRANLSFDGSTDAVLDVRITHDFRELSVAAEVRGRVSKPELTLSSSPAQYSQAELLGFLLGGEPGGDFEAAPTATARVTSAGASLLAGKIAAPVKKAIPVDIDVLRYEAASSTASASFTVGTWITDTLFFAYRTRLDARPDENTGEGELEYWIRRRLVLEGVAGNRGVNGVDLLWRRRW